jgi:hypothetical protein
MSFRCIEMFLSPLESAVNSLPESTIVLRNRCIGCEVIGDSKRTLFQADFRRSLRDVLFWQQHPVFENELLRIGI